MTRSRIAALLFMVLTFAALAVQVARAEEFPLTSVPDPLKTWVPWVLDGVPDRGCPQQGTEAGENQCVWPGILEVKANSQGAQFSQEWQVFRDAWVSIPGNARQWPQDVMVDGKPSAVIARDELPVVKLARGAHKISGRFAWNVMPEFLALPASAALLRLELNGKTVSFPVRDEANQLWLQRKVDEESSEQTQVHVFRKVADGVPVMLETYIRLEVSGKGREISLGRVLLPDLIPVELQSPLPATIKPDGSMTVQARAGKWDIRLQARYAGSPTKLGLPEGSGIMTDVEVWVYQAAPLIRTASIEGPPTVDPQQTTLPPEWRQLPAYLMRTGSVFTFKEIRRGDSDPAPDKLTLHRRMWLSFDGGTMTVNDVIKGDISRSSRLNMGPLTQLGHVSRSGQDQLITRGNDKLAGIEVRRGPIDIGADSIISHTARHFPAVGWQQDFDSVGFELILPAGWRLLHAGGADRAQGAWLSAWNLLDFFTVLVIALATGKLWGRKWGVLALFALILAYQEPDAPHFAWISVLAVTALVRVLPAGRLQIWMKRLQQVSLLALVLLTLSFATEQVRLALYPVLERGAYTDGGFAWPGASQQMQQANVPNVYKTAEQDEASKAPEEAPPPPPVAPAPTTEHHAALRAEPQQAAPVMSKAKAGAGKLSSLATRSANYQAIDPDAKVQTGPGLPNWNWRSHQLIFDGPVRQGQQLDLWLLPPWGNKILVLTRLVLLGLLLACVAGLGQRAGRGGTPGPSDASDVTGATDKGTKRWPWQRPASVATVLACVLLTGLAGLSSQPGYAQTPSKEQLEELKQKLTRPADCLPNCAEISRMLVQVSGNNVRVGLDVDAVTDTAVMLPGGVKQWLPAEVSVDGKPAYIRRDESGLAWMLATAGRHRVELTGELLQADTLQLPLPQRPRHVDVKADGWEVSGLSDESGVADTLQLNRRVKAADRGDGKNDAPELPGFLQVTRRLILDKEWQVETTVSRLSPAGQPVLAQIPLLPGEAVTTAGMSIKDGLLAVNLAPHADSVEWRSTLPQTARITLNASRQSNWVETWNIDASAIWHVSTTGLPPVASDMNDTEISFRPWPGESLQVSVDKPQAIAGQTLTIDESSLVVNPGSRAADYELKLRLRSSRGGDYTLYLPEGAVLQRVSINRQVRPIRANGRQLVLPVVPGPQDMEVAWRLDQDMAVSYRTVPIDLQQASVNSVLELKLPHDRWLLLASGPGLGPAILFWGKLVVLLAVAIALGRGGKLPIPARQWIVLALGLTQVPWWATALVIAWFYAFAVRARVTDKVDARWLFNLRQLGLCLLTVIMLSILLEAVKSGLLGQPDMQVTGNFSSADQLIWYLDRADAVLQPGWVCSLPILAYRGLMLLWALWLAWSLLSWLKWGWSAFIAGGLWRQKTVVVKGDRQAPTVSSEAEKSASK